MRTYEEISEILANVTDKVFEKLNYWFDKWVFGEAPKARVNYWLKKVGITEEEYLLWQALKKREELLPSHKIKERGN